MRHDFYAYMDRMKYIKRWQLMRSTRDENIMEHSQEVSLIAHALVTIHNDVFGGNADVLKTVLYAMYHETAEVMTGDLPTPIKYYNKLVRDLIPDIIAQSGKTCLTRTLPEDEYLAMLDEKLNEELAEYQQDKSMEELADLLEVMMTVAKARGSSFEEVEAIRQKKAAERGGFEKRILLTEVHELEKAELLLKKKVDWSVFKDGFAIPLEMQDTFLQLPGMQIAPGENAGLYLVINGKECAAQLRNLAFDREKNPNHVPILQIRYGSSDQVAECFRNVFHQSYADMLSAKASLAPKKHAKAEHTEYFYLYSTDTPGTFIVECFPAKEGA